MNKGIKNKIKDIIRNNGALELTVVNISDEIEQLLDSCRHEVLVMPMFTENEVNSGWEAWLNNGFKIDKKDFAKRLKVAKIRQGVNGKATEWLIKYYTELLEITERYLNTSKHSA